MGIAGEQTGIYPIESPGGWQLIGAHRCRLFNPDSKPEFLFNAGDYIRFYSVTEDEYEQIAGEVAKVPTRSDEPQKTDHGDGNHYIRQDC